MIRAGSRYPHVPRGTMTRLARPGRLRSPAYLGRRVRPHNSPTVEGSRPVARTRPLRPLELAEAAVLADVTVALCLLWWLLPFGQIFLAAAVTPMAVIAVRNRPRAVLAGGIAAVTVSFLIAGTGLASNVAGCAVYGALLGVAWRRRWGAARTIAVGD